MQQVPANAIVGNRYRNCFIPPTDWKFVSSDYNSQELVIIAHISQDPVWIKALKEKKDLHSINAELVFGDKWINGKEDGCQFYIDNQKCKCPKHKTMRIAVKTIGFGLSYGMEASLLASTLKISKREAVALIEKFFTTFSKIRKTLTQLGMFGMYKGYIQTLPPFSRKRYFAYGSSSKDVVLSFMAGDYHNELGIIDRASKNTPIQGASADITKLALVYIWEYIHYNKLTDKVKIVMQVHDQLDTICHKDYAGEWKIKITELMEKAAKVVIPSGLLTSETNITKKWEK